MGQQNQIHYVMRSVHCLFYSDKYRTCYLLVDSYWAKSASLSVVHTVADWLCFFRQEKLNPLPSVFSPSQQVHLIPLTKNTSHFLQHRMMFLKHGMSNTWVLNYRDKWISRLHLRTCSSSGIIWDWPVIKNAAFYGLIALALDNHSGQKD